MCKLIWFFLENLLKWHGPTFNEKPTITRPPQTEHIFFLREFLLVPSEHILVASSLCCSFAKFAKCCSLINMDLKQLDHSSGKVVTLYNDAMIQITVNQKRHHILFSKLPVVYHIIQNLSILRPTHGLTTFLMAKTVLKLRFFRCHIPS